MGFQGGAFADCPVPTADEGTQGLRRLGDAISESDFAGVVQNEFAANPNCDEKKITADIRKAYQTKVKPIFQKKCFDCHNSRENPPWYSGWGVGGSWDLNPIVNDMVDGQDSLQLVMDYPFMTKNNSVKQPALIRAIRSVAKDKSMPPTKYTAIHWGSKLTEEDQGVIKDWADKSLEEMACLETPPASPKAQSPAARAKTVFENKCVACHNKPNKYFGVATDLAHIATTKYIDKASPANSTIYQEISDGNPPDMPPDTPLTQPEKDAILDWIKNGAAAE